MRRALVMAARAVAGGVILMLASALAGCSGVGVARPDAALPAERIMPVEQPVPVVCVALAELPAEPARVGDALSGEARHDAALLAGALLAERGARMRAMALLRGCAG